MVDDNQYPLTQTTVKRQHGKNTAILHPMLPRHFSAKKRAEIRAKEKEILVR